MNSARPQQIEIGGIARFIAVGMAVAIPSWLALAFAAGDIGLQRSISTGAISLILEQPGAVVVVALVALASAYLASRLLMTHPVFVLIGVLAADAFAGLVLAPIAVGELEPIHAPLVFAAVAVLGVQPLAAVAGAMLASRWPARS